MRYLLKPTLFSFVAFSLLGYHPPALAQATTVEIVLENLSKFETEVKNAEPPIGRCRQVVQLPWWARLVPNLQKREQEKADNEWRESNDSYRNFISERQKEALRKMRLVFSRLSENSSPLGDSTSVDPAIRDFVFPLFEERISRLIAEATDIQMILKIEHFLFHVLEIQLQRAMRELLRAKGIRGLVLFDLIRQIENNNPWSQTSQLYSFVEQLHGRILTTATNIQMVDTLVESGMNDLWELCPDCK